MGNRLKVRNGANESSQGPVRKRWLSLSSSLLLLSRNADYHQIFWFFWGVLEIQIFIWDFSIWRFWWLIHLKISSWRRMSLLAECKLLATSLWTLMYMLIKWMIEWMDEWHIALVKLIAYPNRNVDQAFFEMYIP